MAATSRSKRELEGDVFVVHRRRGTVGRTADIERFVHPARAGASASTEKLHALCYNLGAIAFAATVFGFVSLVGDAALDISLTPLLEVLTAKLGLLTPDGDVVPFGAFLFRTGAIAEGVAGRESEFGHRLARREVTHLRVAAAVAAQNYLVHRHRLPPLNYKAKPCGVSPQARPIPAYTHPAGQAG